MSNGRPQGETHTDDTDDFMLGIYSGNLKAEKIVWDFEDPDGAGQIDTALYHFSKGEDLFKDVRQDLRKHGRGGLAEEIKDLRAERKTILDEIAEIGKQPVASDGGKWSGVFADICGVWDKKRNALRACVRVEANRDDIKHTFKHSPDAPSEAALATTANLIHARIDQYNALIDDEAKFVDTAAANLRGWQSATGEDVREVREDVQGTRDEVQGLKPEVEAAKTAAEGAEKIGAKTHGLLAAIFAKLPERLKRSIKSVGEVFDPARKEKRSAVYDLWKQYSNPDEAADPEMPDGSFRGRGERRSYKDFFKRYEDVVVWGHLTLGMIYKSVEELETAINSEDHFRHPEKRLKKQTKGKSKKK